jgi:hypothetical protein
MKKDTVKNQFSLISLILAILSTTHTLDTILQGTSHGGSPGVATTSIPFV